MKLVNLLEVVVMVVVAEVSGGVAGLVYGDDLITDLVGGSGGGHAIRGSGNAGGGGGALSVIADGVFTLEQNASITLNGGSGSSHSEVVPEPVDREVLSVLWPLLLLPI